MTCPTDSLYQMEFEVKTMTRCDRSEDRGCGTAVSVQFLDHPEQMVCELAAEKKPRCRSGSTDRGARRGTAAVTAVNRGKKFTFATPPAAASAAASCSGGGGAKPVKLVVRLYRTSASDASRRTLLGAGELDVVPSAAAPDKNCQRSSAAADEQTIPIRDCGGQSSSSGRTDRGTVAVLTVRARAWCAGPVTTASLQTPPSTTCCSPAAAAAVKDTPPPLPPRPASAHCRSKSCSRKKPQTPVPASALLGCCGGARPHTTKRPRSCRRSCGRDDANDADDEDDDDDVGGGCGGTAAAGVSADDAANTTRRQYTSVGCEIDGKKVDLRVRKRNNETCAVQRKIATEAEAFASRVLDVVKEMHTLVSSSTGGGRCSDSD